MQYTLLREGRERDCGLGTECGRRRGGRESVDLGVLILCKTSPQYCTSFSLAVLERGTARVEIPAWVRNVHTGRTKPVMGLSVAERDTILDRTNSCTPFLRRPDGSPMDDDMATYYERKKCPMDNFFLMVFDTRRGHDMLDHLIVQRKKDASVCHGFIALLSLIDAYQLTDDMCADRVLESESRMFCDHRRPADSAAVVQTFKLLRYERLQAVADLLLNLDNEQECSKVCGGVVDSALCNSFMDAAKFFIDKVPQGT